MIPAEDFDTSLVDFGGGTVGIASFVVVDFGVSGVVASGVGFPDLIGVPEPSTTGLPFESVNTFSTLLVATALKLVGGSSNFKIFSSYPATSWLIVICVPLSTETIYAPSVIW